MTAQELKNMVEWFCDRNGIERPTCKEEHDYVTGRMIRIGLLEEKDLNN